MRQQEGKGYLLRTAPDGPYAGWLGVRHLDARASLPLAPWDALRNLADLTRLLPGGLSLLWNAPAAWLTDLPAEARAGFWKGLAHLPGLSLHLREEGPGFAGLIQEPLDTWLHGPLPPTGPLGLAWRQGWLGWIPDGAETWSLPGTGAAHPAPDDDLPPGFIWGELLLPLGALEHLAPQELAQVLGEAQARTERAFSHRLGAQAWPTAFPFQRRSTGWRVGFLGGREFQLAGGAWERAAVLIQALATRLETDLRCPIHLGVCGDPVPAAALGQQAMAEGLPWRNALPLPPSAPSFTTGLGAEPREPGPLESRCAFPQALVPLLQEPPAVTLRVPAVPMEGAVSAFVAGLRQPPAIRWLPPDLPPPGPYTADCLWAPAHTYPPMADTTQMLQPSLFDDF